MKKTNSGPINMCLPGGQPAEAGPILRQAIETVADGATWFHGVLEWFFPHGYSWMAHFQRTRK